MNESTAISPMLNKKPFIFVVVVLLLSGLLDKAHAQSGADIGASVAEAAGRMIVWPYSNSSGCMNEQWIGRSTTIEAPPGAT